MINICNEQISLIIESYRDYLNVKSLHRLLFINAQLLFRRRQTSKRAFPTYILFGYTINIRNRPPNYKSKYRIRGMPTD